MTRICKEDGCERLATYVSGYYLVGPGRRVRQWVCVGHFVALGLVGKPSQQVAQPPHIAAAEQAEREYQAKQARTLIEVIDLDTKSVKALAPSGHGEPLPGNRTATWRWNDF